MGRVSDLSSDYIDYLTHIETNHSDAENVSHFIEYPDNLTNISLESNDTLQ